MFRFCSLMRCAAPAKSKKEEKKLVVEEKKNAEAKKHKKPSSPRTPIPVPAALRAVC